MKRAVSVSLGNPTRDKKVEVHLDNQVICVERLGIGGDEKKARRLFAQLDGQVDALSVGGIDLYVHLDGRDYPVHAALKLVQDVKKTPLVDGRMLKYALEGRVFELAAPALGGIPRFQRAFIPFGTDRMGLIQAVEKVSAQTLVGDLMFMFGLPIPVHGLANFKRLARVLLPLAGYLPISMLYPPGAKEEGCTPKYQRYWQAADLIAGDLHYIRKYSPQDLSEKTIVTNTTTEQDIQMLQKRNACMIITTTPRYDGRSFGINLMEAVLTAYAGLGRPLSIRELNCLIDELDLHPDVNRLRD